MFWTFVCLFYSRWWVHLRHFAFRQSVIYSPSAAEWNTGPGLFGFIYRLGVPKGRFGEGGEISRELNTNFLFSSFSSAPGISRPIPGISRQKFGFPGLRGAYRTFWPPPLHVEEPHPTWRYPDPKVWVCALFLALSIVGVVHTPVAMIKIGFFYAWTLS